MLETVSILAYQGSRESRFFAPLIILFIATCYNCSNLVGVHSNVAANNNICKGYLDNHNQYLCTCEIHSWLISYCQT